MWKIEMFYSSERKRKQENKTEEQIETYSSYLAKVISIQNSRLACQKIDFIFHLMNKMDTHNKIPHYNKNKLPLHLSHMN